ncbi:MAG TPA: cob(I)yrinic acid a,c-diamide adenosyltransferase [Elusimicrobia bacterium]|nr:MAG: hypothetical protein A2278_07415 [Elusimicrobia bacterium RIFOXYA12_FULL_49_49]OGS10151.1 MAG: hypothetical protein A2204_03830 [Elusimicrobia bacterium RIFOXYA1_FULL_47_7]OGS16106.1 MAG: hypothetical protein A2251_02850 [Elusimicrobia bacterium RIFOXYA2_FULL_47_53]OGS26732.1 MAG: hypothetical protein A2339_03900 [Elusimicrobia bacterium RIFOXYB12_FULL_50_12]OGS30142.1 MAG: hypothetical protein A2323_01685 [Elusimicrobia bacterium RIFOXYB2_FULL_46_23]HBU69251.1 cob(I)yrinic acid a,c-di
MIIINTGDGKGKTTAAVGQVIRSLGRGYKVCIIQLFKGKEFYGEQLVLKKLKNLKFYSFAPKHPGCFRDTDPKLVRKDCLKALDKFGEVLKGKPRYDLIVLEEFNIALRDGYLKVNELLKVLDKSYLNNNKIHVIITGRAAPKALLEAADLVTEMKEVKHPYNKGMVATKGIEF